MTEGKCSVDGRLLLPCSNLDALLQEYRQHPPKGLSLACVYAHDRAGIQSTFVVVSSGKHTKRGICVNFCPICGVDILSHVDRKIGVPA